MEIKLYAFLTSASRGCDIILTLLPLYTIAQSIGDWVVMDAVANRKFLLVGSRTPYDLHNQLRL
jgi:hypothetical protein